MDIESQKLWWKVRKAAVSLRLSPNVTMSPGSLWLTVDLICWDITTSPRLPSVEVEVFSLLHSTNDSSSLQQHHVRDDFTLSLNEDLTSDHFFSKKHLKAMHILAHWSQSLYSFVRHLVYIYPFIAWPPRCLQGWAEYSDNKSGFHGIGFLIQVVSDTVPSPANLNTGVKAAVPLHLMCGGWGALQHLWASRPTALANGRYRRHHDQLLKAFVDMVSTVRKANNSHFVKSSLNLLRPGENCPELKTLLGC